MGVNKVISVMKAPDGHDIVEQFEADGADIALLRLGTKAYQLLVAADDGQDYILKFTTAGGDVLLTIEHETHADQRR